MRKIDRMTAQDFRRLALWRYKGETLAQKFAWPGGYPLYLVMTDGGCLCGDCILSERGLIHQAALEDLHDGWAPMGMDINYEDPALYCDHCNERIESAYAEDDAQKEVTDEA